MIKIILSITAFLLFQGCTVKTSDELADTIDKRFKKEEIYKNTVTDKKIANYRKEAFRIGDKVIDVGFHKKDLSEAMREVSRITKLNFDESFIPSTKYRITIEYRGDLRGFLNQVYTITGVSYKYRNNMLQVSNKVVIERSRVTKKCNIGQSPTVTVALNQANPMKIFNYFSKNYGYNFQFSTKFYSVTGADEKKSIPLTSLFYNGCSENEALYTFLDAIDFTAEERGEKNLIIRDYIIENISIPTYFDYEYTSGQTLGNSEEQSTDGAKVSTIESGKKEFKEHLQLFASNDGKIRISHRGYITVMDHPRNVREIKNIIRTEIMKQTPMELSLSIVRITLNEEMETGTNFTALLDEALGSVASGLPAQISYGDFTAGITKGMTVQGARGGTEAVFKALQTLGDTKSIKEYNVKTRNGILSTFRAVDKIPYITTSTIASTSTTQIATEAKFATAGIIVNLLPQLADGGETVNISTDILISEYLGDKIFNTTDGELKLPQLSENQIQVPIRMKMGESAILTGFDIREEEGSREGVPGLINQDYYQTQRLFGYVDGSSKASKILVIISLKKIEDF